MSRRETDSRLLELKKLIKVYRYHTRLEKSCSTFGELPEVENLKLVADFSNEDDDYNEQ